MEKSGSHRLPLETVLILKRTDLLGAEDPVAGIAQAGDDVAVVIELLVHARDVDVHVRVLGLHALHALGRAYDAHELDVLDADFLQEHRRSSRAAAGGQHRVDDYRVALLDVGRHFEVVLHRLERVGVAVEADVADLHVRHQGHHAVHHAQARAEDGHYRQLLARYVAALRNSQRGLDFDVLQGQVAGRLVAHQHRYLTDKLTEGLGACVLVAQDAQFVLDKGMVEYVHIAHGGLLLFFYLCDSLACRSRSAWDSRKYTGSSSEAGAGVSVSAARHTP